MIDFWNTKNPTNRFFTLENVADTIDYINEHTDDEHSDIFKAALERVSAILAGGQYAPRRTDPRIIAHSRTLAERLHDKAVFNKDFIAAARWRYVMTAVTDYAVATRRTQ